jgi:C-terminal processing protease CtpA/Prc
MKSFTVKKTACLGIAILLGSLAFSCLEDNLGGMDNRTESQRINDWILENMNLYYLWTEQIPSKTDNNLNPPDYFKSLLSPEDRFSWIQEDFTELMDMLSGVKKEAGYEFNLLRLDANSDKVIGYITYVKPNSPASRSGLKRGDFFLEVNGKQLTLTNYSSLMDATSSDHSLGIAAGFPDILTTETVPLQVEKYEENPVFLDTIYRIDNKNIGYLVYNFFSPDNGDKSIRYEKELNDIFNNFKGIDDLILDLRYNAGGLHSTAIALASMIAPATSQDIFSIDMYNALLNRYFKEEYGENYDKSYFTDQLERRNETNKVVEKVPVNRLRLNRLYIITSEFTASASEILINALEPYMEITITGMPTRGKNVGSLTIYEDDPEKQKTNKWGLQPIVVKIANKDRFSGFENGFAPDMEARETDSRILPLGDTNEILLQKTLQRITGNALKSSDGNALHLQTVASSMDRTPARNNLYLDPGARRR